MFPPCTTYVLYSIPVNPDRVVLDSEEVTQDVVHDFLDRVQLWSFSILLRDAREKAFLRVS
jgi:hypothetical protein